MLCCPECSSRKLYKAGLRYLRDGSTVQRFLCRDCGRRFSESQSLNKHSSKGSLCQIGAKPYAHGLVENLTELEPLKDRLAGATDNTDVKGKIVEFLWFLKKEGYANTTVKEAVATIKRLANKNVDIFNPEEVKLLLAREDDWSNGYKQNIVSWYQKFAEMLQLNWEPPNYKPIKKLPFIPHEEEIDQLISGTGRKLACTLQLLKETGMRIGEAWKLQWTDIDAKRNTIKCVAEKRGNPRMFKVSNTLIAMIQQQPRNNQYVFGDTSVSGHRRNFCRQRKQLANKLQNPRLLNIHFHTLRHWKATMEYHKTKDILYVKQLLGHRSIDSTLKYTQLVSFEKPDQFKCRVANNIEEAKELVEAGFQYVTEIDSKKLFRKPK